jgi:hypothetical protein
MFHRPHDQKRNETENERKEKKAKFTSDELGIAKPET